MAIALPDLFAIAVLLLALGTISASKGLVDLLNWFIQNTVGSIPLIGSIVSAPFDAGLQAISNYLGSAASTYETYLGICFHNLASSVEWVGRELESAALFDLALGEHLAGEAVHTVLQDIAGQGAAIDAAATRLLAQEALNAAEAAKTASLAAAGALSGRLGALEGEISDVLEPTVEGLRARAREIEGGFERAWSLLKAHEEALGIGAVTAAVAVALDELGSSWIRCEANGALGRAICGLGPKLIEDLLAGLLDVAAITQLCTLTTLLFDVAESSEVQGLLRDLVGGIDALIACRGITLAKPLPAGEYVELAPAGAYAELAPLV